MPKTYKGEALAAVHEMMEGLHESGAIDKRTLCEFDEACLVPATPLQADEIKALREAQLVSQPIFASYLNVSTNLVSDSERGKKRPGGPALRLLSIIQRKGRLFLSLVQCSFALIYGFRIKAPSIRSDVSCLQPDLR